MQLCNCKPTPCCPLAEHLHCNMDLRLLSADADFVAQIACFTIHLPRKLRPTPCFYQKGIQYRVGWVRVAFIVKSDLFIPLHLHWTKANSSRLGMQQGTTTQPVGLRSLGVSRFLFLYISTCILYDSQHSRAFGNSHFGWWVKMSQVPPMAATALIRFVRNFSKSLTSRMLSSTGCLGVISWDVKPNARETCMTALTSMGYKHVIIFLSTWCWHVCVRCGSENDVYCISRMFSRVCKCKRYTVYPLCTYIILYVILY